MYEMHFPIPEMRDNLSEFFLMEVILNRRIVLTQDNDVAASDPDFVVVV